MSSATPQPYNVVFDSDNGLRYEFATGYLPIPEAPLNAITSLTGAVLATGPGAAAASFALPMILNGTSSPASFNFTGKASDTSTATSGIDAYLLHNTANNHQLVLAASELPQNDGEIGIVMYVSNGQPRIWAGGTMSGSAVPNVPLGLGLNGAGVQMYGPSELASFTTTTKNAISNPQAGMEVYDSTLNQVSYYNGSGWVEPGAATPAGMTTQIQYNNAGAFGASANLTFDPSVDLLSVANGTNTLALDTATGQFISRSGTAQLALQDITGTETYGSIGRVATSDLEIVANGNSVIGQGNLFLISGNYLQIQTNDNGSPSDLTWTFGIDGGLQLAPLAAEPLTPVEGEMIYNSTTHHMEYYNGTIWVSL